MHTTNTDTNGGRILDLKFEILNFRFDMQKIANFKISNLKYVLLACKIGT